MRLVQIGLAFLWGVGAIGLRRGLSLWWHGKTARELSNNWTIRMTS
jgi:hypothetical protein